MIKRPLISLEGSQSNIVKSFIVSRHTTTHSLTLLARVCNPYVWMLNQSSLSLICMFQGEISKPSKEMLTVIIEATGYGT